MQNKKPIILGSILAVILIAIGVTKFQSYKNEVKSQATFRNTMVNEQMLSCIDAITEYTQKRYDLLVSVSKSTGSKLPTALSTPFKGDFKTEASFQEYDKFYNAMTEALAGLMKTDGLKKRLMELEQIERNIDRKRKEYQSHAQRADEINQDFNLGKKPAVMFPENAAEKSAEKK
jgi:hypothetical protein